MLLGAYKKDLSFIKNKKQNGVDNLELAKEVLELADKEEKPEYALTRALTHLEVSMQNFVKASDEINAIIVGLYLSIVHFTLGNKSNDIFEAIWKKVPIRSLTNLEEIMPEVKLMALFLNDELFYDTVSFHKYGIYVQRFLNKASYNEIIKTRALAFIEKSLNLVSTHQVTAMFSGSNGVGRSVILNMLKLKILERKNNVLQLEKEITARDIYKGVLPFM